MVHPKIKRMVKLMQEKKSAKASDGKGWLVYILQCKDGTYYTGVTNDMERRLKMHNAGRASRYTRIRRPVEVIYQEPCLNRPRALARECEVKAYSRKQKEQLIQA